MFWSSRRFLAIFGSLLLIAVVGGVDYLTGYQISVAVLYYIPIACAVWFLGWGAGFVVSLICVATMAWAEIATGLLYPNDWILAERSFVRLIDFGFVAYSFHFFRRTNDRNERKIDQLERLITFCTCCHRLQDSEGNWTALEQFNRGHPDLSRIKVCPTCAREAYSSRASRRT